MMRTIYPVWTRDSAYEFDNLGDAIRHWDQQTHDRPSDGGIAIQQWDADGNMIRDGWLIHVEQRRVYVNPSLEVLS